MHRKLWRVASPDKNAAAQLAQDCDLDPTLALLLVSRGITAPFEAESFLSTEPEFDDPFLLKDMDKAVQRLSSALDSFQKIAVFGDYDADGVTSTCLLYRYLSAQGANVTCHIPDRLTEGYGMSVPAVEALAQEGVQLIITVDNGISAFEACEAARRLHIDVIVTDHHQPGDTLPTAVAVVNPHRRDCPSLCKDLAGVGVAFKLLCAMEDGDCSTVLEEYGDLIALGTLADIVPLRAENRALVKIGLQKINTAPCVGLQALCSACGLTGREITASNIGFGLAPRINAAGRMGSAAQAMQLLLCEDTDAAADLAAHLNDLNKTRQQTEADILQDAILQIEENPQIKYAAVLVVAKENWHPGVIGIVAARLVTRYGKPAVVISLDGETGSGSCRSIPGFSVFDALQATAAHLLQFGGHPGAAGLKIQREKVDAFRSALDSYAKSVQLPFLYVDIDFKLNPASVGLGLLDTLSVLEPFGCENPAPIFGLYHMTLAAVRPVGEGRHLRLTLKKGITELSAMLFGTPLAQFPYQIGDTVDLAVQIEKNEFRGVVSPSLQIKEIRFSQNDEEHYVKSLCLYEKYRHGDALSPKEAAFLLPSRPFLVGVYRFLQYHSPYAFDAEVFCTRSGCQPALAARFLVALDVLCEAKLAERSGTGCRLCETPHEKFDLEKSEILNDLKERSV